MKKLMSIVFCICVGFSVFAAQIVGVVSEVIDGDTIKIVDEDGGKFKVRFNDIDAPQKDQEFGKQSKEYLESLIDGKMVSVRFIKIDMYGRILGDVYLNVFTVKRGFWYNTEILQTICVNRKMVEKGYAWWYQEYSNDKSFKKLEESAKEDKLGLWKSDKVIPPWQFRKENKDSKK